MCCQTSAQCEIYGSEYHRDDDSSENCVRHEDGEVHHPEPSLTLVRYRSHLGVIVEIGDKKSCRCQEGGEHRCAMSPYAPGPDETHTRNYQTGTGQIEQRVQSRQIP